jgi:hypothetical protein
MDIPRTGDRATDEHGMKKASFIAETDIRGAVKWVCRFGPDDRIADSVRLWRLDPGDLVDTDLHGASKAAAGPTAVRATESRARSWKASSKSASFRRSVSLVC